MGELLLCSRELALVPYYIENISTNVYSLEELCYYLTEYIDLVEVSFMDEELIQWIGTALQMEELSEKLEQLKAQGMFSEFVCAVASGCNYCTEEEILCMQDKLTVFEHKSEVECKKIRADRLLQTKRYHSSISAYKKLLEHPQAYGAFAGDIYHNMGTAYAGLFLFEDAAACYGKAYERNKNPLSKKQRRSALQLAAGIFPQSQAGAMDYRIPEEALDQWKEAYLRSSK